MAQNKELELAYKFVNSTNQSIFLTGKAGTGKTTFLHRLKRESLKRLVVVAPTGVAAINAKGVTIHSFFQMPFGPILPETDLNASKGFNRKFSKTKINIIKSIDLLVIDEISMVRADLLDGIDRTLRRFRNRNKVFGGVQVLMIGDLQQLSPVIKEQEWEVLKQVYKNGFFFSSQAFQQCQAITIELKHIYRQENPKFIEILNAIRDNQLTESIASELNKRYISNFQTQPEDGYISLTTHNNKADAVNKAELDKLTSKKSIYKATLDGKFPEYAYPNSQELTLKVGAQVMFVKNDSHSDKRYFNGKIGKVIHLDSDEVVVHCPDDEKAIIVTPETWENITYNVDPDTKAITEEKIGSYTQIPLRLAWSITIHKSQGLTFEKAIIDAEGAFAHGQTYVALSRCKSLEGLVLKHKIHPNQIVNDSHVTAFNEETENNRPDEIVLSDSQKKFQLDLMAEIFEFFEFLYPVNRILDIYYKNRTVVEGPVEQVFLGIKDCVTHLLKVSNSFKHQLNQLSEEFGLAEKSPIIQERFIKGLNYFASELEARIVKPLKDFAFTTDNQTIGAEITKHLDHFEELLEVKLLYFKGLECGFKTEQFLELRAQSVFQGKNKPKKSRKTVIDGTSHVELFEKLRLLRNDIARENDLIHYQIFSQKALYEMCETLPTTTKELLQINGMGKKRVEKYGSVILKVIRAYCEVHNIETSEEETLFEQAKPKRKRGDSKKESLLLFQSGKSIEEIAHERELNENTVFTHLASFIKTGETKVTDLISEEHYNELKALIPQKEFETLSDLKHQLDEKYSYGALRLVLENLNFKD
ncbi:helix-turn-helix domain-containing protein [Tamlana fucoidanivorans]|uniref:Helicase n=1 Tax=Allotamlana fucoidanivorans TaxID=2583814 RepID=A0A5C4SIJ3_9FLAO|nr:helix-turn-helix domain-containing protein [Tamlana fucoidanivorans]TNJ43142.1 helicase [Tamlana fucoidanivorans]